MSGKTVFLSYRRDATGKAFTGRIHDALKHHGYDSFIDVEHLGPGKWEEQILTEIPKRSHFLLIITPNAFERCDDPNDWLRQECELAIKSKRNIVPIREESVDSNLIQTSCPESMKSILKYQYFEIQHGSFEVNIARLIRDFIPTHKAPSTTDNYTDIYTTPTFKKVQRSLINKISKFLQFYIDPILTLLVFAAFIQTLLQGVNGNWDAAVYIPIVLGLKGIRSTLLLPYEIRVFAFVSLFSIICGLAIIAGNLKAKREIEGGPWITSFTLLSFGLGMATVLTILQIILPSRIFNREN